MIKKINLIQKVTACALALIFCTGTAFADTTPVETILPDAAVAGAAQESSAEDIGTAIEENGAPGTAEKGLQKDAALLNDEPQKANVSEVSNPEGYSFAFKALTKQQVTVELQVNDKNVNRVSLLLKPDINKAKAYNITSPTSKTYQYTFPVFLAPNEHGVVVVTTYFVDGSPKQDSYEFTMDASKISSFLSHSAALKKVTEGMNNHSTSMRFIVADDFTVDDWHKAKATGKWKIYNRANVSSYYIHREGSFFYNGTKYMVVDLDTGYSLTKTQDQALRNRYKAIAKKASRMSTKNKIKYFNKYLASTTSYKLTHKKTSYGFMMTTKKGQCMHYAYAFGILCNLSGIPCEYVNGYEPRGDRHAWNIVKYGKKWYYNDACWADAGKKVNSRWCLRGYNDKAFKARKLNPEFKTTSWKKAHPLGKTPNY